jgi:protein O-mannosyl-transferase
VQTQNLVNLTTVVGEALKNLTIALKINAAMGQIIMGKTPKIKTKILAEGQPSETGTTEFARGSKTSQIQKSLVAALVAVLTFAVYLPALQNGFVWDDVQYITGNSFIRSINGNLFKSAFLSFQADNWHPLTWVSHAVDFFLWGLNPVGHHLTNITLHAMNTILVVLLLMQLVEVYKKRERGGGLPGHVLSDRQALMASGITGLLFGLHPLHVESVAWVSERKDLLCALFYLLSVLAYVKAVIRTGHGAERKRLTPGSLLAAFSFFVLALLSKPMAVTLPVVLLIADWFPLRRIESPKTFWTAFVEKLPFFLLALISSVLTVLAQKTGGAMGMMQPVPLSTRLLVASRSLIAYLGKMIVPVNLVPYYPYPESVPFHSLEYFSPVVLAAGITLLCVIIAKRQKVWLAVWGYFIVTLLPVLGLVQVGDQAMADRYTYLPSLGPFFIIGLGVAVTVEKILARRQSSVFVKVAGAVAAVVLVASMSYATIRQIGVWRNNGTFWSYVIAEWPMSEAESPKRAMAYNNLGLAYASQGQWDRATTEFQAALRLKPGYVEPHYNLGLAYASQGRLDRAVEEYQVALRLKPDSAGAHNNLGIAFASQGKLDKAIAEFRTTSRLKPNDAEPHMNLGLAYTSLGQVDRAIAEFQTAIQLRPDSAGAHYNLGNAYASQGLWDRAITEYQSALWLNPDLHQARQRLSDAISRRR